MLTSDEEAKKHIRSKFQRHATVLIWKCYLQRQRRWRLLLAETFFAALLMVVAVFIAKPVFLTPLQAEPEPPLASADLLASLNSRNLLGYAPTNAPYANIMTRAAELLHTGMMGAATEDELINILYTKAEGTTLSNPVIWVIWKPKTNNSWKFSIRSTERARTAGSSESHPNPHLRAGFLAVQAAVSQAIIEYASIAVPHYEVSLVSMPVSPLMQELPVRRAISGILLCITLALIPPVLEAEALVVQETVCGLKRAFRIRDVDFSTLYISWLVFAYMTVLPICLLVALTLIFIFRWIHLFVALIIILAYVSVMIMIALITAMFHSKAGIACLWTVLFTFMKTFLAEITVHHEFDLKHMALTFALNLALPPLGLVHALNEFAMLQTGRGASLFVKPSLFYTIFSWSVMNILYFAILMILQRTLRDRALGGAVSWKSIIFKKVEDPGKLRPIKTPTGMERQNLQEVDELVAKAICFRNCTKSIMGVPVLNNVTLDIYRGEFTMLFAERVQERMLITIQDLLTGLTFPDEGSISVLGHVLKPGCCLMAAPQMMGYCHYQKILVEDLTVEEHLIVFTDICLWNESQQYRAEYIQIRSKRIYADCDLEAVRHTHVRNLGTYYRAQLCWAIALLMEPRIARFKYTLVFNVPLLGRSLELDRDLDLISKWGSNKLIEFNAKTIQCIILPHFTDKPSYVNVIKDKIMHYKKYVTIVMLCFSSIQLEYADRVFIFDSQVLVFGGTPAYMFFRFGREYRVRMTFRGGYGTDSAVISELLERAGLAGATVRGHLGSLLILRLPSSPTAKVAALVKDISDNASKYGIVSLHISLPDTEEVSRRAITEVKATRESPELIQNNITNAALKRIAEPRVWKRKYTIGLINPTQLKYIMWKYVSFYLYYKTYIIIAFIAALVTGVFIGNSLSNILAHLDKDRDTMHAFEMMRSNVLTVEALEQKTTLVIRSDNTTDARSIATGYVLSETHATDQEIEGMLYTALPHTESLTEFLVTRAIDSPQHYVYMYAYGMDVSSDVDGEVTVQALYSPLHHDQGAAARSLARVYTALLRHYSKALDATIEVTDDPLTLDLTSWMVYAGKPPIMIQFLLILTISHITVIPSKEHGLVRHIQSHALNFSPARYWLSLFFCDLLLYWLLVCVMTVVTVVFVHVTVPQVDFSYIDLAVVPCMLIIYGFGCIPQAYLFSIGPHPALNSMTFVIVNVVFGQTTMVAKLFYGDALHFALYIMRLSPQFNMAYAYVKIKQIFLYNSECVLFKSKKMCSSKILHKCCEKCGLLQECFSRKNYFTRVPGILIEVYAIIGMALLFAALLLLWEYHVMQRIYRYIVLKWTISEKQENTVESIGVKRERAEVTDKLRDIKNNRREKVNTFGEYLLSNNVSKKEKGLYILRNIYFGIGKGEILALSGLKRHGRLKLCEMLAGYKIPCTGQLWCMSKWKLTSETYKYARNVSISCELSPLPLWMTVHVALAYLAVLRGVPKCHVASEIRNLLEALELEEQANTRICRLRPNEKKRVHFAAAVVGAPTVLVIDECTAYQTFDVRRAMYFILHTMKKQGHAIFVSASSVETHMPLTNRLAILVDGHIHDIDLVDRLVARYSDKGYTVVVHLKDEVNVNDMFSKHFKTFIINDTSEVLVNIQVLDDDLDWAKVFERMEALQAENPQVYSYIVSAIPIDYIYNSIIASEHGLKQSTDLMSLFCLKKIFKPRVVILPKKEVLDSLTRFEKKYDITRLKELPWSVIFQR